MNQKQEPLAATSFIPRTLRPEVSSELEEPPLEPAARREDVQRRAHEALGPLLRERLGIGDTNAAHPMRRGFYCRSPEVIFTTADGEGVLLNLHNGVYYSLNRVGMVIWDLLSGEQTLEAVRSVLCERFDVSGDEAWDDLTALMRQLRRENLVMEMN